VKLTNGIILAALVSVVAACGAEQTKDQDTVQQDQGMNVASEADEQTAANLPSVIVARVPLDADGNELADQGEAREVFSLGNTELTDGSTADAAFGQGAAVSVADELDADSSTQSTHRRSYYWNTPWYPGKLLGHNLT